MATLQERRGREKGREGERERISISWPVVFVCLGVCVCSCVCRNRCTHVCIHAWRPEDNFIGCSSDAIALWFFSQGLSLAWSFLERLGWPASKL